LPWCKPQNIFPHFGVLCREKSGNPGPTFSTFTWDCDVTNGFFHVRSDLPAHMMEAHKGQFRFSQSKDGTDSLVYLVGEEVTVQLKVGGLGPSWKLLYALATPDRLCSAPGVNVHTERSKFTPT
jgi:hypothetical protein